MGINNRDKVQQTNISSSSICKPVMLWICISYFSYLATGERTSCNTVCECYDSTDEFTVHCPNKGLSFVPADVPDNVTYLDLSKNSIPHLNSYTFHSSHLTNLLRLDLRLCDIREIEEDILENLRSLEELHLNQNKLKTLSPNTFSHLKNLQILSLNNNDLISIGNYTFKGLRLDHLNLNDNSPLFEIEPATFLNSSIAYLSMDRCSLSTISVFTLHFLKESMQVFFWSNSLRPLTIPEQLFDGFHLDTLHMSDDGITDVDFLKNTNVIHLDLSRNPLGEINLNFQGAEGLKTTEYLSLSGCHLKDFEIQESTSLPKLHELDLSHNRLTALRPRTFLRTRKLARIDLTGNLLQSLLEMLFRPLNSLEYMDLSTNPLICDCKLEWLRKRVVKTNGRTLIRGAMCHSPIQMALSESLPFICQSPNISGFHMLPEVSGGISGIKVCCDVTGSPKPSVQLSVVKCSPNSSIFHNSLHHNQTDGSFHNFASESSQDKGHIDSVGSNTCEAYVQVDLVQCCVIECKASNTEGETLSVLHTCDGNNTHNAGGPYTISRDTNSDPSEGADVPRYQRKHWYNHEPILICIGISLFILVVLILTLFIIWYKDRYKKLRRWHQLSPSINRRGRDNYPAAVGLITSGGSGDLDCEIDLDDDIDLHAPL